jgi:hypothetical protein
MAHAGSKISCNGSDGYRLWQDHWHMPEGQIITAQKLAPFILIASYVLCRLLYSYAEFHAIAKM